MQLDEAVVIVTGAARGIGRACALALGKAGFHVAANDLRDEATRAEIHAAPVITLDGCKRACARVNVELAGAHVTKEVSVLDLYRQYPELKPQGISQLNDAGLELARRLAAEVAAACDALSAKDGEGGTNHA